MRVAGQLDPEGGDQVRREKTDEAKLRTDLLRSDPAQVAAPPCDVRVLLVAELACSDPAQVAAPRRDVRFGVRLCIQRFFSSFACSDLWFRVAKILRFLVDVFAVVYVYMRFLSFLVYTFA